MIKKIANKMNSIIHLLNMCIKSFSTKFVMIGTPIHGNLGDQAISIGQMEFLNDKFSRNSYIDMDGDIARNYSDRFLKFIIGNKTILIQGGGFLGDLYMREENMVRRMIQLFPNNKIVIFPQTLYFKNGDVEKKRTIEIYDKHKNLSFCVREQFSYDLASSMFKNVKIYLIPDMVLYLKRKSPKQNRSECVFCMRNDKEKILSNEDLSRIKEACKNTLGTAIKETDTVLPHNVSAKERYKYVNNKIDEFTNAKFVITDRLHGMVMAYLARAEVIVFNNCNYKIKGIYNWIKDNKRIHLVESYDEFERIISKPSSAEDLDVNLDEYYNKLAKIIGL